MGLETSTLAQTLITCLVIAYVAFCFLYGHAALRSRRAVAASMDRGAGLDYRSLPRFNDTARFLGKLAGLFLAPVCMVAVVLSFAGRERSGIIEAANLFTVPARNDATVTYLAANSQVEKGDVVVRFASDNLEHRIAGLKSRRQELLARRDAIAASSVTASGEMLVEFQANEQRLSQFEQKLTEQERARFLTRQQLASEQAAWQRTRTEMVSRLPSLQQALASELAEHRAAQSALERIRTLRERGFATLTQFERTAVTETVLKHKVTTTEAAIASTQVAIDTLDATFRHSEQLLTAQLAALAAEEVSVRQRMEPLVKQHDRLRKLVAETEEAGRNRRLLEISAAEARVAELDAEVASAMASAHVKTPIAGRILYRNAAPGTLSGSMPMLVVASRDGILMRVDVSRDEVPALKREQQAGQKFKVVVDDSSVRRLAVATLSRIDDNGIDPKRVTAVFSVEVPEDMLVRMALRGTAPRGVLSWSPSMPSVLSAKIAAAFGRSPTGVAVAGQTKPDAMVPAKSSAQAATNDKPVEL